MRYKADVCECYRKAPSELSELSECVRALIVTYMQKPLLRAAFEILFKHNVVIPYNGRSADQDSAFDALFMRASRFICRKSAPYFNLFNAYFLEKEWHCKVFGKIKAEEKGPGLKSVRFLSH